MSYAGDAEESKRRRRKDEERDKEDLFLRGKDRKKEENRMGSLLALAETANDEKDCKKERKKERKKEH